MLVNIFELGYFRTAADHSLVIKGTQFLQIILLSTLLSMLLLKKMIPALNADKLEGLIRDFDLWLDSKRFLLMVFVSMT